MEDEEQEKMISETRGVKMIDIWKGREREDEEKQEKIINGMTN